MRHMEIQETDPLRGRDDEVYRRGATCYVEGYLNSAEICEMSSKIAEFPRDNPSNILEIGCGCVEFLTLFEFAKCAFVVVRLMVARNWRQCDEKR
jgi:hypothetical protein